MKVTCTRCGGHDFHFVGCQRCDEHPSKTIARLTEERDRALSDHATIQGYLDEEARLRREAQDEAARYKAALERVVEKNNNTEYEGCNCTCCQTVRIARAALDGGKGAG